MSQRRTEGGRLGQTPGERDDVKAMTARTRSRTGSVSVAKPAQPSAYAFGGATPPATRSELPSWFWGVLGCMCVLVVGFAGLWWAASSGIALSGPFQLLPGRTHPGGGLPGSSAATTVAPRLAGIQVEQLAARIPDSAPALALAHNEPRRPAPRERPAPVPPAPARAAKVAAPNSAAEGRGQGQQAQQAAEKPRESAAPAREVETVPHEVAAPETPPSREAAVLREISGPDDEKPRQKTPRDAVEAVLKTIAPRVRQCFNKFQIPGRAEVQIMAAPKGGKAESVNVTGEFEGTPTGDCITDEVQGASLPSFKGTAPVEVTYTYALGIASR